MTFEIHPQLLADTFTLGRWERTTLLLHRNASVPWFILVPETDVTDLIDLPPAQLSEVLAQSRQTAGLIRRQWSLSKINFAALGNVVPQLHLHVIGRSPGDACWPRPVWGQLPEAPEYAADQLAEIRAQSRRELQEFLPAE